MATYTKKTRILHSTETVYYKDGEEIGFVDNFDTEVWDVETLGPMTDEEIEDWDD